MGDFNYDAPQYVDFTSPDELLQNYGEEYFDMDHEIKIEYQEVECNQQEQITEIVTEYCVEESDPLDVVDADTDRDKSKLRRSVSASSILLTQPKLQDEAGDLSSALEALQLSEKKNNKNKLRNGLSQSILPSKTNVVRCRSNSSSTTTLNKPLQQKSRAVSRDAINKIGFAKNDKLKRKMSEENLQPNKYISLAEAINKFQFGTPLRFHTKAAKIKFNNTKTTTLTHTVPHSPMLSTKSRARQTTCVSQQELEAMEADEIKKNQIKAQPINYKILRTPVLSKVEKKPNTVPQPFKFTEVHFNKSHQPPKEELYEFHARPAPKSTSTATKPIIRRSVYTVSTTPTFMKRQRETLPKVQEAHKINCLNIKNVELQHDGIMKIQKLARTKPEPFSFEQRDKIIQQRKEEKIKKILEEEKKAREFHARPIMTKVAGGSGHVESKVAKFLHDGSNSSLNSIKNDENMEPNQPAFKAKPATVIHKKPFIPKKDERPLIEISEFNLNSNKRAKEREEFDKKMKEKEEEFEKLRREQAERQKMQELETINKIRKETIHKANPVKHYKPVDIHPSTKKITSPVSPMFSKKRISRFEN